jgi:hypothetical protein
VQIAREGWGMQKSQNGGANPTLSGPATTSYHLWAVAPQATPPLTIEIQRAAASSTTRKVPSTPAFVGIGKARRDARPHGFFNRPPAIDDRAQGFANSVLTRLPDHLPPLAQKLAPIYRQTLDLRAKVAASTRPRKPKPACSSNSTPKSTSSKRRSRTSSASTWSPSPPTPPSSSPNGGFSGGGPDETPRSVSPGEEFNVRVHTAHAASEVHLEKTWLEASTGSPWQQGEAVSTGADRHLPTADAIFKLKVPADAEPTQPYFTRPNTEQPYYDLTNPEYRERSFAPWPLAAWAEFTFDGLPIRVGKVVQTMQRVLGPGGIYEPLVVTPAIGVSIDPEARILPLDGSALPVRVTVHAQAAAEGTVSSPSPPAGRPTRLRAPFHLAAAGDTEPILFSVTPAAASASSASTPYAIKAVASTGDSTAIAIWPLSPATSGWQSIGYPGLRPYNLYKPAQLLTRKVDVKLAPGLRVGYIMGTGDLVPDAIEALGVMPAPTHPSRANLHRSLCLEFAGDRNPRLLFAS